MLFLNRSKVLLLLVCSFLIWSCAPPQQQADKPEASTLDSLHQQFADKWNAGDVEGISNTFTKEVTLMYNASQDQPLVQGREKVTKHWVEQGAPAMKDLETKTVSKGLSHDLIYIAGKYKHNMMQNDTVVGPFEGLYTFIWTPQKKDQWKIQHIHLQQTDSPTMMKEEKEKQMEEKKE